MMSSPRRRWSVQAFLWFLGKLHKGSHFPWVRTNYLQWRLHLTHCQLCVCLFEALFVLCRLYFFFESISILFFLRVHFNPSCNTRSLILFGLVLKMGFQCNWKKAFFCFWRFCPFFIESYFKQYWHWFCE